MQTARQNLYHGTTASLRILYISLLISHPGIRRVVSVILKAPWNKLQGKACQWTTQWLRTPARTHAHIHQFFKTRLNIKASSYQSNILHSLFSSGVATKISSSSQPHQAWHLFRPPHPPWCHHPHDISRRLQVMKLSFIQFSPSPIQFLPLRSKHSTHHPILKHPFPSL